MGQLSANMLEAARKPGGTFVPFATFEWVGSPDGYYSVGDVGTYEGRLLNVGDVQLWDFSAVASDLSPQDVDVELADSDGAITAILEGSSSQYKAPVTLRQGSMDLSESDWWTFFTGIVRDWSISNGAVTLHCTTDARALETAVPEAAIRVATAPVDTRGAYWPVVYGIHDAENLASTGMVAALCYARSADAGYRYCVTRGVAKSIPRVYKSGTLMTLTTDYTITYPTIGGVSITSIDFVAATTSSDSVTCDVESITDDGTTSGTVIADPVSQILHWLQNDVLGGTTRIDLPSLSVASSYMSGYAAVGAFVVGGETTQEQALSRYNSWLRCWPMIRSHWNSDGKLAMAVMTLCHPQDYSDWPWFNGFLDGDEQEKTFATPSDGGNIARTIEVSYVYGADRYWAVLPVQDLSVDDEYVEPLQLSHGPAEY